MWCSMQCISCRLDNRRVKGHHRGCSQLRPPVRFTGCSQCLSPSRRWRWVSLLHTNTMTELWPWRCRSFTSSSSPGPRPQFGRIQSVSPPSVSYRWDSQQFSQLQRADDGQGHLLSRVGAAEQKVGGGAGERGWTGGRPAAAGEHATVAGETPAPETARTTGSRQQPAKAGKRQIGSAEKSDSPEVSNSDWREDRAGGQEQPPDPGTQEVQRKNNNRNSSHTIIPPTIYNDYLIIKGWNWEIW